MADLGWIGAGEACLGERGPVLAAGFAGDGVVFGGETEYGPDWIGTALEAGTVVHHGDIPKETREALEELLRAEHIRMDFCTSTLAEGVNLPIRTLVLYSKHRLSRDGVPTPMLARDVKNLVGRAGRAGASTKGMVICVNPNQWHSVSSVADGAPGEPVTGALRTLIERLANALRENDLRLTNQVLEVNDALHPLVDGIDATLIELMHDDLGAEEFQRIATTVADRTYAYQQVGWPTQQLLENVFALRAERLVSLRENGRLAWTKVTGAKPRLLDSVIDQLIPSFTRWDTVESAVDDELLDAIIEWAWRRTELHRALREGYPDVELHPTTRLPDREDFRSQVRLWLDGSSFAGMAATTSRDINVLLRIHTRAIAYTLTTLVEQAVAIIARHLADDDLAVSVAVVLLPDYLSYGVTTPAARNLMAKGVRHRRAAILLGADQAMTAGVNLMRDSRDIAAALIEANPDQWRAALGDFVFERTARALVQTSAVSITRNPGRRIANVKRAPITREEPGTSQVT